MKSERRHELQTNELAVRLNDWIKKIGPYKNLIIGGLILVLVAIMLVPYLMSMDQQRQAAAWTDFFSLAMEQRDDETIGEGLMTVAKTHSDTKAGRWAAAAAGNRYLQDAISKALISRDQSRRSYNLAKDSFQFVVDGAVDPILIQRGLMGLAQCHEALGELDDAIAMYQQLAEKYPESILAATAEKNAARLSTDEAAEWYDWFASYEPTGGLSDSLFQGIGETPGDPNFQVPGPGNLIKPDSNPDVNPESPQETPPSLPSSESDLDNIIAPTNNDTEPQETDTEPQESDTEPQEDVSSEGEKASDIDLPGGDSGNESIDE